MTDKTVQELRADVRKLRSNATRKVARLRAQGIALEGSRFDVRRSTSSPAKYTRAQLESYAAKLQSFNSRQSSFVADAQGKPIPKSEWQEYKSAETTYNKVRGQVWDAIKGQKRPGHGPDTVEQKSRIRAKPKRWENTVTGTTNYEPVNRKPSEIFKAELLSKLTRDLKRKASPKGHAADLRKGQKQFLGMAQFIGDKNIRSRVAKLTPGQWEALWSPGVGFAHDLGTWYQMTRWGRSDAESRDVADSISADMRQDANDLIDWVATFAL